MTEDSGINGFPFGDTSISNDTGCRCQGCEIHLARDCRDPHIWRIIATAAKGALPHQYLLDKPDGEPLAFDTEQEALAHALTEFQTVGGLAPGTVFYAHGKRYLTIKVPNWVPGGVNFIPVLDLETYFVSGMQRDTRPERCVTKEQRKKAKGGEVCEPSSSAV